MQPAFSVIFLTTLIGAAQGLFLALYGTTLFRLDALDPTELHRFVAIGSGVAWVLSALGLAASFFHLGQPTRAWRSATMWRTSWLSREVIALPLFMFGLALYGVAHFFAWGGAPFVGIFTLLACVALFVCTAMVYASIRFLQEWASPWTLVNYTLLGCASGLTLATLLAALCEMSSHLVHTYALTAMVLTMVAWLTRSASLRRNARLQSKSTLQSAIGIRHPRIVQKAQGFMGGSFNTREFFHGRSSALLRTVKWAFLLMVFPLPILALALALTLGVSSVFPTALWAAFAIQYIGLLAERWFFFAQANHPQNLYYQNMS